jgi:pimeloyl-ACP methyl ester carboxylesterase
MKKQYLIRCFLLSLLILCLQAPWASAYASVPSPRLLPIDKKIGKLIVPEEKSEEPVCQWITVFVHGTFGLQAHINIPTFIRLWRDEIECSSYVHQVGLMRADPAYYTLQPMQEQGLKQIKHDTTENRGPYIFSLIFNEILKKYRPNDQPNANYTFGWSGLVSVSKRYAESRTFYQELQKEIAAVTDKTGCKPKIRLIGYSHGGSLCLNLAGIHNREYPLDSFGVDELILIGVPVQTVTSSFMYDPIFKAVYNIYSAGDHVQRMDIFSYSNLLSHKKFHNRARSPLPEKLRQVELKLTSRDCARPRNRINRSPGHIELWFFGWTPSLYHKAFPFYPLPAAVFIPYIMEAIDNCPLTCTRRATLHMQPDLEQSILDTAACSTKLCIPFMSPAELQTLKQQALDLHPNITIKKLRNNQKIPVLLK